MPAPFTIHILGFVARDPDHDNAHLTVAIAKCVRGRVQHRAEPGHHSDHLTVSSETVPGLQKHRNQTKE